LAHGADQDMDDHGKVQLFAARDLISMMLRNISSVVDGELLNIVSLRKLYWPNNLAVGRCIPQLLVWDMYMKLSVSTVSFPFIESVVYMIMP
jgi:hypothetical protein